jgi:hypothetical protein
LRRLILALFTTMIWTDALLADPAIKSAHVSASGPQSTIVSGAHWLATPSVAELEAAMPSTLSPESLAIAALKCFVHKNGTLYDCAANPAVPNNEETETAALSLTQYFRAAPPSSGTIVSVTFFVAFNAPSYPVQRCLPVRCDVGPVPRTPAVSRQR